MIGHPDEYLNVINRYWEIITNKIKNGKAQELSEGDTFYLVACTKGLIYGKLISKPKIIEKILTIEEIVISKFKPFYGKTSDEIYLKD